MYLLSKLQRREHSATLVIFRYCNFTVHPFCTLYYCSFSHEFVGSFHGRNAWRSSITSRVAALRFLTRVGYEKLRLQILLPRASGMARCNHAGAVSYTIPVLDVEGYTSLSSSR